MVDLIDTSSRTLTDIKTPIAGGINNNQLIAFHNAITVTARQAYKTMISQSRIIRSNRGNSSYTLDEINYNFKYSVTTVFPFEVKSVNEDDSKFGFEMNWFGPKSFVNRLEAETYRLNSLVEYYQSKSKENGKEMSKHNRHKYGFKGYISIAGTKSKMLSIKYQKQLDALEEDHPEWLI